MVDKKAGAFFLLMLCHAVYDIQVKKVDEFSVNLAILYNLPWLCFALYWWYDTFRYARTKFEKAIMIVMLVYFAPRLLGNIFSINQNYEIYSILVNNQYIDYATWVTIVVLMSIKLWQNVQRY